MKFLKRAQFNIHALMAAGFFLAASVISLNANGENQGYAGHLFERLDRNGDGGLSLNEIPEQMQRLRNAFDIVDSNGDGIITADEFSAIRAGQQQNRTPSAQQQSGSQDDKPAATQSTVTGEGANGIRARLQRAISNKELPGAVIVFTKNGKVVFEEVYGYADIERGRRQQIDDLFNLGSTSKPLAMTTVMTQVADGKIALDDPISKWNPKYANKKLGDGARAKRSPTVREMMSHTSGTFAVKCGERRDLSLLYMFGRTLKDSAEAIANKPLVYQPGEGFCYGGPAMQVLSRTIEVITGEEFDELAKAKVFMPLGMKDTFYRTNTDLSNRITVIYDRAGNSLKRSPRTRDPRGDPFILAPGGVYSTAKDLSRFVQMQLQDGELDGKRILPKELVLEMRHNQIGDNKTDFGDPSVGDRNSAALGKIEGYGLGWILDELKPDGSARVFSHGGAWGTYIWGDADAQLAAILLTQTPLTYATPVWNDVLRIARSTWGDESQSEDAQSGKKSDAWAPEVRQLGDTGAQYIDPEILGGENLMTFQDQSGKVWVARLDPVSGLFSSVDGKDMLMAEGALSVRQTYNGPEFGLDKNGWSVFFTKAVNDVPQVWRSRLSDGKPQAQPLYTDSQRRQSVLASKNEQASEIDLLYVQGKLGDGHFFWADGNRAASETKVVRLKEVDSPRWIDNTMKFVFVESDGKDAGQIKLVDTELGKVSTITNDAGVKSFAYGWRAPEFDDELLVLALVDYTAVGVWRDTAHGYWQRIATLTPPKASRYKYFGSPEPFVSAGNSYVSLVLKDSNTRGSFRDSEVWILGIDNDATTRFTRRVDDGLFPVMRSDPEIFSSESEIYVYYNAVDKDKVYEIHRARTGLSAKNSKLETATASDRESALTKTSPGREFDCINSASCVSLIINGAPPAVMSNGSPSIFRGAVDASLISDPQSGVVYLAYTSVASHEPTGSTRSKIDIAAGIA
ncbi:MAG: serine hydrolase, partial [Gammaproteobacteria bacterium]|nr:serine hydrolase [Gammaproteobacteria bacterium]